MRRRWNDGRQLTCDHHASPRPATRVRYLVAGGSTGVTRVGEVYLTDWGLAKVTEKCAALTPTPSPTTALGAAVGTPGYMAPEQAEGRFDY